MICLSISVASPTTSHPLSVRPSVRRHPQLYHSSSFCINHTQPKPLTYHRFLIRVQSERAARTQIGRCARLERENRCDRRGKQEEREKGKSVAGCPCVSVYLRTYNPLRSGEGDRDRYRGAEERGYISTKINERCIKRNVGRYACNAGG